MTNRLPLLLMLLLISASGCGDGGPRRYDVSGSVTFRGEPLPRGRIDFEPDTAQGNSGPAGTAEIRTGRFATEAGRGIVGGPHVVRISGSDGNPLQLESGDIDPAGKPLFNDYVEHIDFPQANTEHNFAVTAEAAVSAETDATP